MIIHKIFFFIHFIFSFRPQTELGTKQQTDQTSCEEYSHEESIEKESCYDTNEVRTFGGSVRLTLNELDQILDKDDSESKYSKLTIID